MASKLLLARGAVSFFIILAFILPTDLWASTGFLAQPCFMEGIYDIKAWSWTPPSAPDEIGGTIGQDNVRWYIMGPFIRGTFKGEPIKLNLDNFGFYIISGWIHNQPVRWIAKGNRFYGTQDCIK